MLLANAYGLELKVCQQSFCAPFRFPGLSTVCFLEFVCHVKCSQVLKFGLKQSFFIKMYSN